RSTQLSVTGRRKQNLRRGHGGVPGGGRFWASRREDAFHGFPCLTTAHISLGCVEKSEDRRRRRVQIEKLEIDDGAAGHIRTRGPENSERLLQVPHVVPAGAVNLYGMEVLAPTPARHVQMMDAVFPLSASTSIHIPFKGYVSYSINLQCQS